IDPGEPGHERARQPCFVDDPLDLHAAPDPGGRTMLPPTRTPLGTRDELRAESIVARDGWFPAPTPDLPPGSPPGALRLYLRRCWRTGDGLARALLVREADGFLWLA